MDNFTKTLNDNVIEAIIEDNPNPILIYKNNNWVYLNLAFSNLFGFSLAELNRNDFYQLIAANLDDSVEFSNAIKNENNYKCEYIVNLKTEQGNDILCNISFKTLKSNDERYNIFILNNNSKVADARKKLKESKDFNLFLMQNTGDFIWILNQFNVIEFIAESVTEKLEFSVDELVDKNIEDILSEESKKELDRIEKEIAEDSAPKFIILEFMNKRKHRLLFETDVKPLIVDGEIKGYLGISRDLSNKMIEFQTHNIYKKISKAVLSNIMLTELYKIIREEIGNVIKSPNFVLAMYDEKNEMLNIPYMEDEFDNFEKIPMKGTISSLVIKEKKSMMFSENELLKLEKEGEIGQVGAMCKLWLGTPLIVEEKVMGIIMIQSYQDRNAFSDKHKEFLETISNQIALFIKQKSILQELKEEGQKFRSIAENLPGVIYVYDVLSDGTRKPVYIGPGLEDFIDKDDFNYSDPMQSFCKMISDEDKKLIEGSTADEQEKLDINYQLTTNDNHNVTWVRSISSSIKMENNVDRIIGIILNITDRVKYQNRIAESENKFRLIVENSSDAIIIYNKFHEVVECNNASCKMYDYTKDEMLTKTVKDFLPEERWNVIPDHLDHKNYKTKRIYDEVNIRKGGIKFYADLTTKIFKIENSTRLLVVVRDITEKKKMQHKISEAQKMDSIGNLAGGVAHDFNNMLGGISGIVSLLEMKETEYDKIELLHAITKAVNRSSELTKKLLAFGRKGKNLNKPVNVNDTINDVISIIGNTISKNIAINMNLSESLNFIDADPNQINQVILNLCVNAAESIEDNIGKINITTENIILDEDFFDTHPEHKLGDYVKITVEDTGYGMDKETQRKIYEPFFTTKIDGQVKGTGLGLATVYGIIINHKGIIDLKSKVDEGSKFEIYFPKGKKVPKKVSENKSEIKLKSVKESLILIIEDDEINRRMLVEMFKILGHKVLVASNGVEGVKIYQERFADIDLVFMDMAIPLMEEKSAYLKMKKINSQIKSVLVTDYSHDEDVQEILDLGVNTLLLKPFELSSVQRALEENL